MDFVKLFYTSLETVDLDKPILVLFFFSGIGFKSSPRHMCYQGVTQFDQLMSKRA